MHGVVTTPSVLTLSKNTGRHNCHFATSIEQTLHDISSLATHTLIFLQVFTVKLLDRMRLRASMSRQAGVADPMADMTEEQMLEAAQRQAGKLAKQADRDQRCV